VWVNPLCQGGKNEREALRKNAMRKVRKKSIYTVHIEYKKTTTALPVKREGTGRENRNNWEKKEWLEDNHQRSPPRAINKNVQGEGNDKLAIGKMRYEARRYQIPVAMAMQTGEGDLLVLDKSAVSWEQLK